MWKKVPAWWLVGGLGLILLVILWLAVGEGRGVGVGDGLQGGLIEPAPNSDGGDSESGSQNFGIEEPMMEAAMVSKTSVSEGAGGGADLDEVIKGDRLIIKTARLSVVSDDVSGAVTSLADYAKSVGGFVVETSVRSMEEVPVGTVTLRVPAEQFDTVLGKVRETGIRVVSENVTGEDVTEEYVDQQAHLRNLEASEAQFMEIMKRAVKIEDVLQVQRQLESVRDRIERTKGQMQYMERSAKLSTIIVNIAADEGTLPVVNPADKWRPLVVVKTAFGALLDLLKGVGSLLIWVGVFAPIWMPVGLLIYWLNRRRKDTVK